jgi:hypothetical protein
MAAWMTNSGGNYCAGVPRTSGFVSWCPLLLGNPDGGVDAVRRGLGRCKRNALALVGLGRVS